MLEKELFKGFQAFSDFPQEHLLEMAQWGKVLELDLNATIFKDGDKASELYGVVDGQVELTLMVRDKILKAEIQYEESIQTRIETIEKEIVVESIAPGEIFGWSALTREGLFTSTARCSKSGRLISLPATKLKAILDRNPKVGYAFMNRLADIISQRLKKRTDKLIESWSQAFGVNSV